MNLKLDRGEAAFWAEYQNEPLPEEHADEDLIFLIYGAKR